MKQMSECKGFNMKRLLLKNKNGYMVTGYYKDGMIQADGDTQWTQPLAWSGFILLEDLANKLKLRDESEKVCEHKETEELNGLQHCLGCGGVRRLDEQT